MLTPEGVGPLSRPKPAVEDLEKLSPFELKNLLIHYAREHTENAGQKFLNAGRGNPNWIATTPREAFLLIGQFALEESKRVWDEPEPGIGGMPARVGSAERLRKFLARLPETPGKRLLARALDYGITELGFDADSFAHELADSSIGDNYPEPDRMLVHTERIVLRYLEKTMCADRPPAGKFQLFAVEGGTAAMCYTFKSLFTNGILKRGDTIALGSPIFTPYVELPLLEDFSLRTVMIQQDEIAGGRHAWQYTEDQIRKLADPSIKAFFLVNPSNPASFAMHPATQERIVQLVRKERPDLILLTDDVYGTFSEGFRSLAADLPRNTILVYSYSKHFGCTGWRLGVIALHEDNVIDERIASLPEAERERLRRRYHSLTTDPDSIRFIDRIVADSRDVALNHTAGLSLPQQLQMALFSLDSLLDHEDVYTRRCRAILHERFQKLMDGIGLQLPSDALRIGYYAAFDLALWGRGTFGDAFAEYVDRHHDPIDIVLALAQRYGTVLLNGSGFDGPPWSVRTSLANLNAEDYEAIGRNLKRLVEGALERFEQSRRSS